LNKLGLHRREKMMNNVNADVISMIDARKMIIACYKLNEPLMLLGKPGMGKTSLFNGVAQELGIGYLPNILSQKDPVDVGGMRVPDLKTGVLKHYIPEDLPDVKRHGEKGILHYDEINVASMLMQATAYGIIQERRLGASWRMPPGWVPMASGNNVTDRSAAQRLSLALANRFNIQQVEPDLQSWLVQYGSENVDTRGCAFLRFRPELFHVMPTTPDEIRFPSARSWTKAFKFIDEAASFRRKIFAGYVGTAAADEFEAFWRILENAPSFQEIVDAPQTARVPEERDAGTYYAVAGMLARLADRVNFSPIMAYTERLLPDYQVAIVQDATRREPGLKNTGAYAQWAVRHQDVTL
jgi:hypothetical protein